MTVDGDMDASKRLRTTPITIGTVETEVHVNEDTEEPERTALWTTDGWFDAEQLQAGIDAELKAFDDFELATRIDYKDLADAQTSDYTAAARDEASHTSTCGNVRAWPAKADINDVRLDSRKDRCSPCPMGDASMSAKMPSMSSTMHCTQKRLYSRR